MSVNITESFKKEIALMILSNTFWYIWSERNDRVFSDKRRHKLIVLRCIKENIKLRTLNRVFRITQSPELDVISRAFGVQTEEKERVYSTEVVYDFTACRS
ncbi:hypothetical protein QJS10_CPB20g01894 [Acorus calamus]|uniref:Uncharacterized protein n=1 Tax=Acorus calamus TaxID=4465 RepID=A0AAV9CAB7_ACOCL|nr:hypothetical protein QJS10_CPB20g01894 [Acorus calamus]